MKHYGLLAILVLFSSTIHAENCTPQVNGKKVTVEFFDGNGNLISSETHRVRSKNKYKDLVSNAKAFEKLKKDKTGNVKVRSSKLDLKSGGMTTRVSKEDGTVLAMIGGCPVAKLKFYEKIGSKKKPFIHTSLIELASRAKVPTTAAAKTNPETAEIEKSDRVKHRTASNETANLEKSLQVAIQPTTRTDTKSNVSVSEGPPGTPWETVSEPMNDVYGWLAPYSNIGIISVYYGKRKGLHYQTIAAGSQGTFSLSGRKFSCMHIYFEHGIPVQSGEPGWHQLPTVFVLA